VEQYFARYRGTELFREEVETPVTLETLNLEHVLLPTSNREPLDCGLAFEVASRPLKRYLEEVDAA
jgi:hypothetical protein